MEIRLEVFTFPIVFNEVGDRRGPLNDSQIRQPNPQISGDLCIKLIDIVFMPITRNLLYHFEACLSFEESIFFRRIILFLPREDFAGSVDLCTSILQASTHQHC